MNVFFFLRMSMINVSRKGSAKEILKFSGQDIVVYFFTVYKILLFDDGIFLPVPCVLHYVLYNDGSDAIFPLGPTPSLMRWPQQKFPIFIATMIPVCTVQFFLCILYPCFLPRLMIFVHYSYVVQVLCRNLLMVFKKLI